MASTACCLLSRSPAAVILLNRSGSWAWRIWAISSTSPCRSIGQTRRPARRRRPPAAPARSAARSGSPSASASRANAIRHKVTLPVLCAATLRVRAWSSSSWAWSSRCCMMATMPSCPRDQAASQALSSLSPSSRTSRRLPRASSYRPAVVCIEPSVPAARAVQSGSSWLPSSSSAADAARKAPSRSPAIGAAHAMASWDTACMKGSSITSCSAASCWRAASAVVSSPTSTAITAAAHSSSARACGTKEAAVGRSWPIQPRASLRGSRKNQNGHKTRSRCGSRPRS
jgi:hypothetical protein